MNLIIESLRHAEQKLHGEFPLSVLLWNPVRDDTLTSGGNALVGDAENLSALKKRKKKSSPRFEPRNEEAVSNWLASHLRDDIGERGVVVNREVVIRPSRGSIPGQRTDISIDALLPGRQDDATRITVIIEVKGNWNTELSKAMETQLRDSYLKENSCHNGLYVVACFDSPDWNPGDYRSKLAHPKQRKLMREKVQAEFDQQARQLSEDWANLRAFVLDCRL
jgi:hypothetical protein